MKYMKVTASISTSCYLPVETENQAKEILHNTNLPNEKTESLVIQDALMSKLNKLLDPEFVQYDYTPVDSVIFQEVTA